jgi:hypothetical protein
MSESGRHLGLALVGNRRFPRYVIARVIGREAPMWYWTGRVEEPWSPDPRVAARWADPEIAAAVLGQLQPDADRDPEIGCG